MLYAILKCPLLVHSQSKRPYSSLKVISFRVIFIFQVYKGFMVYGALLLEKGLANLGF